jgi:ubiquinone/menaquinone biosynthesis C-methylase UbiE
MFEKLEKKYTGIDISKKLVKVAKKRYPSYKFRELTVEGSPTLRKKFDLAFTFTTLEHITAENWPKAIESLKKVARYGVFIEPTGFDSVGHCHDHEYTKDFKVLKKKKLGDKTLFYVDLGV